MNGKQKIKKLKEKIKHLEDVAKQLAMRSFIKHDIQDRLSEHNLTEEEVLGIADDINLMDELRYLGLN